MKCPTWIDAVKPKLAEQAKALFQRLGGEPSISAVTNQELNIGTQHMSVEKATISSAEKATIVHAIAGSDLIRTWDEIGADARLGEAKRADAKQS